MDGPKSRAYLEDPVVKRTFGYAVGDTLGGGRVESIAADRVVIGRGDGSVEVLLHDPSKPRPTPPAPGPAGGAPAGAAPSGTATTPSATPPTNEPAPAARAARAPAREPSGDELLDPRRVLAPGRRAHGGLRLHRAAARGSDGRRLARRPGPAARGGDHRAGAAACAPARCRPATAPAPPAPGPDAGGGRTRPARVRDPAGRAPSPPAAEAPPASSPASRPPARQLVLNFDNADVEVVIQAAAEIVGFNYVLAPAARGRKITVQTVGKISSDEVFAVLLTILDVNGLAAVRSGNLYRIILRENAPQTPVKTIVGREVSAGLPADEVVTQVVPLQFIGAQDAIALLRPFVPAQGALAAHRETNLLIVTDSAANVRRLLEVLNLVDVEVALSELQIIALKHADAQELAQLLAQLFASGRVGAAPGAPGRRRAPGPGPPAGAPSPPPVAGTLAGGPPADRPGASLQLARRPRAQAGHGDHPPPDREARRGPLRGPAGLHLLRGEHQGPRPRHHARRHLRARGSRPGHHRLPAVPARLDEHLRPHRLLREPDALAHRSRRRSCRPRRPRSCPTVARPAGAPTPFPGLSGEGAPPAVEIRFVADEVTNAVIVTTYPRLWKEMEETIRKLDKMPRQVLIEVLAAEVTLTDDTKLGIEWAVRSGRFDVSSSPSGLLPSRPASSLIPLGGAVPVGFNVFTFAADKFLAALNALASENRVNVLSNPSIMTAENRKAVINVSTSVPIVTSQQVPVATGGITGNSITQTVEYRDAGIILTVTPRIGEQGTVALDVKQEVNEVGRERAAPDQLAALHQARGRDLGGAAEQPDPGAGRPHPEQAHADPDRHPVAEPHPDPGLPLRVGREQDREDRAAPPDHPANGRHRAGRGPHHRPDAARDPGAGGLDAPGPAPPATHRAGPPATAARHAVSARRTARPGRRRRVCGAGCGALIS